MRSTAAAVGDVLPPIRTEASQSQAQAQAPVQPACSSAASSSTAPASDAESVALPAARKVEAEEPMTPTSERSMLRAPIAEPAVALPAAGEAGARDQAAESRTPTSEKSRLRAPAECPPAPRKPTRSLPATPPAAKRKFPSSAAPSARRTFFPVARDLTTMLRALPPKKRIRAC